MDPEPSLGVVEGGDQPITQIQNEEQWAVAFHRLEQRTIILQRENEELKKRNLQVSSENQQNDNQTEKLHSEVQQLRHRNKTLESELVTKTDQVSNLQQTKRRLVEANANLTSEYDRLGTDLTKCQEKVLDFSGQVHQLEVCIHTSNHLTI